MSDFDLRYLVYSPSSIAPVGSDQYLHHFDALYESGYRTVGKLLEATDEELLGVSGFGEKSLARLKNVLRQHLGFELGSGLPSDVMEFGEINMKTLAESFMRAISGKIDVHVDIVLSKSEPKLGRMMQLRISPTNLLRTDTIAIAFRGTKGYAVELAYTDGYEAKPSEFGGGRISCYWGVGYLRILDSWDVHRIS